MSRQLQNLTSIERSREAYWRRYPDTSPIRLRWRANAARHSLHIAPSERVLELGAGSGLWTERLVSALSGTSRVTAAVFNAEYRAQLAARNLPDTDVVVVGDERDLPEESYDCVVGTAILSHDRWPETLEWIYRLLKPGGQLMFFEANYTNPQVYAKAHSRRLSRWSGNAERQVALYRPELEATLGELGFEDAEVVPYDILHPRTPARLVHAVQKAAFVLEHVPLARSLCGTLFIMARRPGRARAEQPRVNLAHHDQLHDAVSVVVPCHNEAMNVERLVRALVGTYDEYLHEIVLVNDNSTDDTAEVIRRISEDEPRVRLVDRRPPGGVGRALRDGYAAATGEYILSMDCDFEMLVPELRDLFDVVAQGHDGAIGSRFTYESVLVNYPAGKLLGNRAFHLIVRAVTGMPIHDVTNNLKLYRASILKSLDITQDGFAANAETGLKPLLAGYDVVEVPIAWINRSADMGTSTFRVLRVAPGYVRALGRMLAGRRGRREPARLAG